MAYCSNSQVVPGLVSVIIPIYNGEKYIADAIDSVLAQTYGNVEVVAIDDGSQDNSGQVVRRYGDQVRLLSQENSGVAAARNVGIAASTGEFVAFLDQDDWWALDKLQQQIDIFRAQPDVGLVHSTVTYYDESGEHPQPLLNEHAGTHEVIGMCFDRLLLGNGMYNSSVIVRRSVLDEVGGCDAAIPGNTVQDYDLWLRIAKHHAFAMIADPVAMLRLHGEQGIWNRPAMLEAELMVLLKNCPREEWVREPRRRKRLAELYDAIGVAYRDLNMPQQGRKFFFYAFKMLPELRSFARFVGSWLPLGLVRTLGR